MFISLLEKSPEGSCFSSQSINNFSTEHIHESGNLNNSKKVNFSVLVLGQVLWSSFWRFFFWLRFNHLPFGSAVLVNPFMAFNTLISASNLAKYSSSTWNGGSWPRQSWFGLFMGQKPSEKYKRFYNDFRPNWSNYHFYGI